MTPEQTKKLRQDAIDDAKYLALLLLVALEQHDTAAAARVRWNPRTAEFLVAGRVVSFITIRTYLARIENKLGRRLLKITTDLAMGRITIDQWRSEFEKTIRTSHVLAGALAVGGIFAAVRNKTIIARIEEQLSFADQFVKDVRAGKKGSHRFTDVVSGGKSEPGKPADIPRLGKAGSPAKVKVRAKSYMNAAHVTFEEAKHDIISELGIHDEARRYMRAFEHCSPCAHWAGRGWIAIEIMPKIGSFSKEEGGCSIYCKCYIVYRKSD